MEFFKKTLFVIMGMFLTAFGIKVLSFGTLLFGGTAGIATIITFLLEGSWGLSFFIANIPFFILSLYQLGKWFTLTSFLSIVGISFMRDWLDIIMPAFHLNMLTASIIGGLLIGIGVTFVLNNGSSLGGIHILGLFVDRKFGLNRGITIFLCDSIIILLALFNLGLLKALFSIVSIVIASFIIGRYKKSLIKEMESDQTSDVSVKRSI